MAVGTTQIFLGSTPIDFYYLGENQISYEPKTAATIPINGLIYAFDSTNTKSYPGSGSIWRDLANGLWAAPFSSSTFPTYNSTDKDFNFNGTSNALMVPLSSSIATGSRISDFTQIMWVKIPGTQAGNARGIVNLQVGLTFGGAGSINFDAISFNDDANVWRLTSADNARNVSSAQTESVFNTYFMITATRTSGADNFRILKDNATVIATGSFNPALYTSSLQNSVYSAFGNRFYNNTANPPEWASDGWASASLSSVILYNRVLSDSEIQQIYSVGRTGIAL